MLRPLSSFLRFPGGKSKHVHKILQYFENKETEYREPFVGGGSVYLGATLFTNSWINDIDEGVFDLWLRVKENPNSLIDLIEEHTPILDHRRDPQRIKSAMSLWNQVKLDTHCNLYPPGYRFLFLSKTCFSGVVTGGPTGGIAQNKNYNLTSRWAKKQTINHILQIHERLQDCRITNLSWEDVVKPQGKNVALYLDPPYLKKGPQCYREAFTLEDHQKLADVVTSCYHRYVVTVDNITEVRDAWKGCGVPDERMIPESWLYSMAGARKKNKVGEELFIVDEASLAIAQRKREERGEFRGL